MRRRYPPRFLTAVARRLKLRRAGANEVARLGCDKIEGSVRRVARLSGAWQSAALRGNAGRSNARHSVAVRGNPNQGKF